MRGLKLCAAVGAAVEGPALDIVAAQYTVLGRRSTRVGTRAGDPLRPSCICMGLSCKGCRRSGAECRVFERSVIACSALGRRCTPRRGQSCLSPPPSQAALSFQPAVFSGGALLSIAWILTLVLAVLPDDHVTFCMAVAKRGRWRQFPQSPLYCFFGSANNGARVSDDGLSSPGEAQSEVPGSQIPRLFTYMYIYIEEIRMPRQQHQPV
jgi:hypothetical protein